MLVGGKSVHSCITPVGTVNKQAIVTIEGLAVGDKLHPVQEAFLSAGAFQCGYCTPGMILSAVGLLNERPHATDAEILSRMEGHICRCGGYIRILRAIRQVANAGRAREKMETGTSERHDSPGSTHGAAEQVSMFSQARRESI